LQVEKKVSFFDAWDLCYKDYEGALLPPIAHDKDFFDITSSNIGQFNLPQCSKQTRPISSTWISIPNEEWFKFDFNSLLNVDLIQT